MDQVPRNQIGYMQVQFKIYYEGDFYTEFVINAYDDYYMVESDKIFCKQRAINDPANRNAKVVEVIIKLIEFGDSLALLIPVHQSKQWEVIHPTDKVSIGFYCILGEPDY